MGKIRLENSGSPGFKMINKLKFLMFCLHPANQIAPFSFPASAPLSFWRPAVILKCCYFEPFYFWTPFSRFLLRTKYPNIIRFPHKGWSSAEFPTVLEGHTQTDLWFSMWVWKSSWMSAMRSCWKHLKSAGKHLNPNLKTAPSIRSDEILLSRCTDHFYRKWPAAAGYSWFWITVQTRSDPN